MINHLYEAHEENKTNSSELIGEAERHWTRELEVGE